jgi:hypothetical protein
MTLYCKCGCHPLSFAGVSVLDRNGLHTEKQCGTPEDQRRPIKTAVLIAIITILLGGVLSAPLFWFH